MAYAQYEHNPGISFTEQHAVEECLRFCHRVQSFSISGVSGDSGVQRRQHTDGPPEPRRSTRSSAT